MQSFEFDIIVPCYNASGSIEKMINAYLSQGYDSFRLIIINDGSSDNTKEICERYVGDRVILIDQPNKGANEARKAGFRASEAEFIMFCDADDYPQPGALTRINEWMNTGRADITEFSFRNVVPGGGESYDYILKDEYIEGGCIDHYIKQKNTRNFMWNKVFDRRLIRESDFVALKYSEDFCFLANVFIRAKTYRVHSDVLHNYVLSEDSACRREVDPSRLDMLRADKYVMDMLCTNYAHLKPFHAATVCSHAAKLYAALKTEGHMTGDLKRDLLKIFGESYSILRKNRAEVYGMSSKKRRLSIELFRMSPNLYTKLFVIRKEQC